MNATILLLIASTSLRPGGDMRDVSMYVPPTASGAPAPTVTIGAMPYTRTTTCTGSYVLTGTATNVTSVAWAASPSGESGACTGTTSWSCTVAVSPDATGEGVETITVTATGAGGTGDDTETLGFYVDGAHSCFLAQSIDGDYNSTLADNDAVATWENLGSSGLDVTQGTGTAQPTYKTAIVGGQPVVRCDGGDHLAAATAAPWTFLHNGDGATSEAVTTTTSSGFGTVMATSAGTGTSIGVGFRHSTTFAMNYFQYTNTTSITLSTASNAVTTGVFDLAVVTNAAADTPDTALYFNGSLAASGSPSSIPPDNAANPLSICATPAGAVALTGDLTRIIIYEASLTSTQRDINQAVDEWALGGTLPVTP